MAEKDRFSALERALPFAAIAETIFTKGKSPGTTSLGQLDRVDKLRQQESTNKREQDRFDLTQQRQTGLDKENAITRQLQQDKLRKQIDKLGGVDALSEAAIKRSDEKQLRENAIKLIRSGQATDEADAFRQLRPLEAGKSLFSSQNRGQSDIQALADILKGEGDKITVREEAKAGVEQKNLKRSVRGFKSVDDNLFVEPAEIATFKKSIFAESKLKPKLDEIIKLIETEGNQVLGAKADILKGKLRGIQLDIKGPEFAALGVLAGPDVEILESVTGDPTSAMNAFFSLGGDINPALVKLKDLQATLQRNKFIQGGQLGLIPVFKNDAEALASGLQGNFYIGDQFIEAD